MWCERILMASSGSEFPFLSLFLNVYCCDFVFLRIPLLRPFLILAPWRGWWSLMMSLVSADGPEWLLCPVLLDVLMVIVWFQMREKKRRRGARNLSSSLASNSNIKINDHLPAASLGFIRCCFISGHFLSQVGRNIRKGFPPRAAIYFHALFPSSSSSSSSSWSWHPVRKRFHDVSDDYSIENDDDTRHPLWSTSRFSFCFFKVFPRHHDGMGSS